MSNLKNVRAVLFDLNETFMFGGDRLDENQDFYATYRRIGGARLSSSEVQAYILRCCAGMAADYEDPTCTESFPSLSVAMARYASLPREESSLLQQTLALHELGSIPDWAAESLGALASTHSIGVVTNIWSPKGPWLAEFDRASVTELFSAMVFSSDGSAIKPSPLPFEMALHSLGRQAPEVLFVGDSLERDVVPARNLGMPTAWVSPNADSAIPDFTIPNISRLCPGGAGSLQVR